MAYGGLNLFMDAAAELGRNPLSKHQIQYGDEQADAGRDCRTRLARPNSQARKNADREMLIFPVELTTCRIGNLTQLIHTLAICVTIQTHTYVQLDSGRLRSAQYILRSRHHSRQYDIRN